MYLTDLKINSIYFGYEFYNPNYRLSTFDYVNYKIGIFYSSLDDHNHDYGLEFNYGINYSENNNMFISFRYGNRSHSLLDFDNEEWTQISNDPIVFQTKKDNVSLEIEDSSHKTYKLIFKNGAKLSMFRVTGKFRLTWDDEDLFKLSKS